jgi:hypothetical protein
LAAPPPWLAGGGGLRLRRGRAATSPTFRSAVGGRLWDAPACEEGEEAGLGGACSPTAAAASGVSGLGGSALLLARAGSQQLRLATRTLNPARLWRANKPRSRRLLSVSGGGAGCGCACRPRHATG